MILIRKDEIGQLASAFNTMAADLEKQQGNLQKAIAYEYESQRARELDILLKASEATSSSLDFDTVMHTLASQLLEISGFESCFISEWDKEANTVVGRLDDSRTFWREDNRDSYSMNDYPRSNQVLLTGNPIILQGDFEAEEKQWMDGLKRTAVIILALYSQEKVIGLVEIETTKKNKTFNLQVLRDCQKILANAAFSIKEPLSANEPRKLFEIEDALLQATGAEVCSFSEWNKAENRLYNLAVSTKITWATGQGTRFNPDLETWRLALDQGKTINFVRSENNTTKTIVFDGTETMEVESLIIFPLRKGNERIGVIELYDFNHKIQVTPEQITLLRTIADKASYSIENARLLGQTQKRLAEQTELLNEKEVLLKEIHHRVKNNLQIISSLLNLQARQTTDPLLLQAMQDSQSRVRSMALIHEKLYQSQSLAKIDFGEYVKSLAADLFRSYKHNFMGIHLNVQVDEVSLDLDHAVSCGLILNELMTNALKYAFPDSRNGTIWVELRTNSEHILSLRVADDGVGLPADLDILKQNRLACSWSTAWWRSWMAAWMWKLPRDRIFGSRLDIDFLRGIMSKGNILIVEDEHIVVLDIQNSLENNDFVVVGQADRGEDAVKKAGELRPDLILMDIGLKGEMDGIEAATQIRKLFNLPVIFLTAFGNPTTVERARLAEPLGFISKPFEEQELVNNIEIALYKHTMEQKLRESENKFRSVIEQASDGIALVDSQGNIIEWNPKMEQITGLKRSETFGQPVWEVTFQMLPSEERTSATRDAHALMWKASITGTFSNNDQITERVIETHQGAHRIVQSNGFVISTTQGPLAGVIMRDITERKVTEAALKESEIIFSSFLEHSQVYVFFKDRNIRTLRLSKNYEQLLGMPISDMLGKTMDDLFPSDLAKSMVADDLRILNEGQPVTVLEEFNGRTYETVKFPIFKDGKPDILAGITIDVTDRKRVEEELRVSEAQHRRLVEGMPDVVYTFSSKRGGLYYSPRVEYVLGYSVEHLYAHPFLWNESIHPDDRDRISETLREFELGKSFNIEYRIQDAHGNWRWLQDRSIGRRLSIDEVLIEGVATDITGRKQMETALRVSEERLRFAMEGANDGIWDVQMETGAVYMSPRGCEILGYLSNEMTEVARVWSDLVCPDDLPLTQEHLTAHLEWTYPNL